VAETRNPPGGDPPAGFGYRQAAQPDTPKPSGLALSVKQEACFRRYLERAIGESIGFAFIAGAYFGQRGKIGLAEALAAAAGFVAPRQLARAGSGNLALAFAAATVVLRPDVSIPERVKTLGAIASGWRGAAPT
jgi:hypothetical protein